MADIDSETAAARVFRSLEGEWELRRTIPQNGTMRGTARFERAGDGLLHYREEGTLQLESGWTGPAEREYFYRLEPDHITIMFAVGGRPGGILHRLQLSGTPATAWPATGEGVHLCGQDVYHGTYAFADPDRSSVTMAVTGPAKDYTIHTELTKRAAGS